MRGSSAISSLAKLASGLIGLTMLTAAAPARAESEHTTLAMPAVTLLFLGEYIAEDLHLWQQQDLDVKVIFIAGIGAMNSVISSSSDFAFASGASVDRAAAHGQKLLTIATLNNQAGQYVVIRKDIADANHFDPSAPLAERAKILKGHTFAMGGVNTIADAYLRVVAKAGGITSDQMTIAAMQPNDFLAAFARGAIDGFSFGPPWPQQVVMNGTGVIVANGAIGEPANISPLSSAILVTRPQFCAEHHSICAKMGHAMLAAVDVIYERPQDALAVLKKRFGTLDEAVLAASLDAVKAMTPRRPITTAQELVNSDRVNIEAGIMKPEDKLASYDELFDNQFIK